MIEEDHSRSENYFRVYWVKTKGTEVQKTSCGFLTLHKLLASVWLINVAKHFQTNKMIVLHDLSFWIFHIHALNVSKYAYFEALPVFIKDMRGIWFMHHKKSQ